jgi:hypothetical protein
MANRDQLGRSVTERRLGCRTEVATDDSGKLFYTLDDAIVVPFISQIATSPEAIAAFRRALVVALRREAFQHFRRSIALDWFRND